MRIRLVNSYGNVDNNSNNILLENIHIKTEKNIMIRKLLEILYYDFFKNLKNLSIYIT